MKQDVWGLVSCSSVLAAEDRNSWSILFHSPRYIHLLRSSLIDCFNVLVLFPTHSNWLTGVQLSVCRCVKLCTGYNWRPQWHWQCILIHHFIHLLYCTVFGSTYTYMCPVNCIIVCNMFLWWRCESTIFSIQHTPPPDVSFNPSPSCYILKFV